MMSEPGTHPFGKVFSDILVDKWCPGEKDDGKCIVAIMRPTETAEAETAAEKFNPVCWLNAELNTAEYFLSDIIAGQPENITFRFFYNFVGRSLIRLIKMGLQEDASISKNMNRLGYKKKSDMPDPNLTLNTADIFERITDFKNLGTKEFFEGLCDVDKSSKVLYIKCCTTSQDHQRKGYGFRLAEAVVDFARKEKATNENSNLQHIIVEATGVGTAKIYKKLGFELKAFSEYGKHLGVSVPDNEVNREVVRVHKGCSFFHLKL